MAIEGYRVKEYNGPVKRYCQTLTLQNYPGVVEGYKKAHSKAEFWDEIKEGIKQVGILEMELYILDTRLVMIVETPLDFDWDSAMDKLAKLPRQAEWEDYVASFQQCEKGSTSDEKWKMMERMFYLYE